MSHWRRWGLGLIGAALALLAWSYWQVRAENFYLPPVWPMVFALGAVLMVALAINPRAQLLYQWAGAITAVGLLSRPIGVMCNWQAGTVRSGWSVVISIVVYSATTGLFVLWWFEKVGAWQMRVSVGDGALARGD